MTQHFSNLTTADHQAAKTMSVEQFEQLVKAILEGRYSWACVLILRFAGYNPAHYIPYRTYKRLIKENKRIRELDANSELNSQCIEIAPRKAYVRKE